MKYIGFISSFFFWPCFDLLYFGYIIIKNRCTRIWQNMANFTKFLIQKLTTHLCFLGSPVDRKCFHMADGFLMSLASIPELFLKASCWSGCASSKCFTMAVEFWLQSTSIKQVKHWFKLAEVVLFLKKLQMAEATTLEVYFRLTAVLSLLISSWTKAFLWDSYCSKRSVWHLWIRENETH